MSRIFSRSSETRFRLAGLILTCGLIAGLTAGCAAPGPDGSLLPPGPAVELTEVPFYPQEAYQCGPTALATVLSAAGALTTPEELVPEVYTPGLKGSLQPELLAAARRRGLMAYPLGGTTDELLAELAAGRPVLVLQNLRWLGPPAWHYAVVVGADPDGSRLVLRSGSEERRVVSAERFLRTWDAADRWAVVLLEPGELPTVPDRNRYLRAATDLESGEHYEAAFLAYRAAAEVWPTDAIPRLGMGNTALAMGHWEAAAQVYARMLHDDPGDVIAMNNLAVAVLELGCVSEAAGLADGALAGLPPEDPRYPVVADTRALALGRLDSGVAGGGEDCASHLAPLTAGEGR